MLQLGEELQPLRGPLLGPVRPSAIPFRLTPWVTQNDKALAVDLSSAEDGIGMPSNEPLNCGRLPWSVLGRIDVVESAGEETVLVDAGQFLLPEAVGVKDVSGVQVRSNTATPKSQSGGL